MTNWTRCDRLVEQARTDRVVLTGPGGLLGGLTKRVLETALAAELTEHLWYKHGDPRPDGNARNGTTPKTVRTDTAQTALTTARPLEYAAAGDGPAVLSLPPAVGGWDAGPGMAAPLWSNGPRVIAVGDAGPPGAPSAQGISIGVAAFTLHLL